MLPSSRKQADDPHWPMPCVEIKIDKLKTLFNSNYLKLPSIYLLVYLSISLSLSLSLYLLYLSTYLYTQLSFPCETIFISEKVSWLLCSEEDPSTITPSLQGVFLQKVWLAHPREGSRPSFAPWSSLLPPV
jgi:hypothetical protein